MCMYVLLHSIPKGALELLLAAGFVTIPGEEDAGESVLVYFGPGGDVSAAGGGEMGEEADVPIVQVQLAVAEIIAQLE